MGHWRLPSGTVVDLWLPESRLDELRAAIARGDKPIGQFLEIAWQGAHPRHWSAEDLAEYRGRAFPEGSLRLSRLLGVRGACLSDWGRADAAELRRVSRPVANDENPLEPGRVGVMLIAHDDWCAHFKGGECDCDPDVELRRVDTATLDHPAEPGQG